MGDTEDVLVCKHLVIRRVVLHLLRNGKVHKKASYYFLGNFVARHGCHCVGNNGTVFRYGYI